MNDCYRNESYIQNYQKINSLNNNTAIQHKETLLKANIGKIISIYTSFPDSIEYRDKIFNGTIENIGNDHILIKDKNNISTLIPSIYINFIIFEHDPIH